MKFLRKKIGLTQKQLAERIGVSQVYISKLEHGNIDGLTIRNLKKISNALNTYPCRLLALLLKIDCDENNCIKCTGDFF